MENAARQVDKLAGELARLDSGAVLRRYRAGDETAILEVLRSSHAHGWGDVDLWRWKHAGRPGFSSEDVIVAELDGRVVGCFHFSILPIKLEDGVEVEVSLDGDFAVLPEYRRLGIPISVIDHTDAEQRRRGAVLRGGFTSEELNERFYHKQFGQVFIPTVTSQYRKILGPGPLMPRVEELGQSLLARSRVRAALTRYPTTIALAIDDFPACHLRLAGDRFELARGEAERPHLRVALPYELLTRLADGAGTFIKQAVLLALRGRVQVHGLWSSLPRLAAITAAFAFGRRAAATGSGKDAEPGNDPHSGNDTEPGKDADHPQG